MHFWLGLLLVFCFFVNLDGYKFGIIVPDISGSQLVFNQRVAETLADAGHNVTLIRLQMFEYKNVKSNTRKDITEWIIDGTSESYDPTEFTTAQSKAGFESQSLLDMIKNRQVFANASQMFTDSCEKFLKNKKFMDDMKSADFDVIFTHMADFCPMGIIHLIDAKAWIWLNSGPPLDHILHILGLYMPPSYAAPVMADMGDHLTFIQRAKSVIGHTLTPFATRRMFVDGETQLFKRLYGPDFPDLVDIAKKTPLFFINTNELYDFPRPTLHKIINIGGIGQKAASPKPLPEEIENKIKNYDSVVVFSFGSIANASVMPLAMKKAFMGAFNNFPKTVFFMRYVTDDMDDFAPKNVQLMKWLPQIQLLNHPKTRVFITHAGYNSIQEAINAGTPLLTVPLFGDQYRNSRMVEKQKLGLILSKTDISVQTITEQLKHLINDDSYQKTTKRMQQMVKNQPFSAEQRLVKWSEFLAEFKTLDNLRPPSVDMDSISYYNVDVYAMFVSIVAVILYVQFLVIRKVYRCCCRKTQVEKNKNE